MPTKPIPSTSITKLMSSIVAIENIPQDREIILTQKMLRPQGGSPVLFPGLKITMNDLVKASLI